MMNMRRWEVSLLLLHAIHFTSVQLTTTADVSLNGYMVASRKDTETTVHYTTLDGNVSYVGSWENGTDMKLLCNEVSTSICMYMYLCTLKQNGCSDYMWRQGWWKVRK